MSILDDQINSLLRKKAQIALYRQIEEYADKLSENPEFPGVTQEVQKSVKTFIATIVASIERPAPTIGASNGNASNSSGHLSSETVQEIRQVAKAAVPLSTPPVPSMSPQVPREEKIRFAKDHLHFAEKTLTARTDGGTVVTGKVVRLDAPYLFIQTKEGGEIPILPATIQE